METEQLLKPPSAGVAMRKLTNADYTNSFLSGISWGFIALVVILFLSWLVSVMRYRRT
jgi:hypothetical protein